MPSARPICWWVACSGGPDSLALLDWALAKASAEPNPIQVKVAHVNHGWHPDADRWADFVVRESQRRDLACRVFRLSPQTSKTEQAAREGRYALLTPLLNPGDRLLVGHHLQDQRETIAMRLLRARPPRGMPVLRPLGRGWLWRPMLNQPKPAYPHAHIQDPANDQLHYERVAVRRWLHHLDPDVLTRLDRLSGVYDRLENLLHKQVPDLHPWPLSDQLSGVVIAAWLWKNFRLAAPPHRRLNTLIQQWPAKPDRQPMIEWSDNDRRWQLRVYAGHLYLFPQGWSSPLPKNAIPITGDQRKQLHQYRVPPWLRDFVWVDRQGELCAVRPLIGLHGEISLEEYAPNV